MNPAKFPVKIPNSPPRVLFAVLNWGLGHATRSIPILHNLVERGLDVQLASDGDAGLLLREAFPHLPYHPLPAYNIRYGKQGSLTALLPQLPHLIRTIRAERGITQTLVAEQGFTHIISDNRYGVYAPDRPSAWIGHQLALLPPNGLRGFHRLAYALHVRILRPFSQLWIPDDPDFPLAGDLVHRFPLPEQARFLGWHSRLQRPQTSVETPNLPPIAVLSGPEPQRTLLENELIEKAPTLPQGLWIVRGLPAEKDERRTDFLRLIPYWDAADLAKHLPRAQAVLARSGYSSLMDFATLRLPHLVLIPTPGQTEQLHLAENLARQHRCARGEQSRLDLPKLLAEATTQRGFSDFPSPRNRLEAVLTEFLDG